MNAPRPATLDAYVRRHLPDELAAVAAGPMAGLFPALTLAEITLIYHYTAEGYRAINARLHQHPGPDRTLLGRGLRAALAKLPAHRGLVYSGQRLDESQLAAYQAALAAQIPVPWPAFLSSSTEVDVAMQFLLRYDKNVLFVIQSRTGR